MYKPSLPTPVKALLFDVFGTVVDWRGSIDREMKKFGKANSIEQDWQQFALDWRALYQPAMGKIREGNRGYVKLDLLHRENLQELLADYGLQACDEAQLQFINSVWHRLRPWADTLPGMNRLKRNFTLGSLSNGNIALMVNMARHSGIPWDAILGSEPTRGYKPQPHVYLDSVEMLGLKPNQCLMVAAHNDDLHAARALGLQTAYINRPYEYGYAQTVDMQADEQWDIVCESMTELADELGC
jgi:2-haloacid dehalogenase